MQDQTGKMVSKVICCVVVYLTKTANNTGNINTAPHTIPEMKTFSVSSFFIIKPQ